MKTIYQNIDTDLQTLTGSTAPWTTTETNTGESSSGGLSIPAREDFYQAFIKKYKQVKSWIGQTIIASLEGQVQVVDDIIREGSWLYPYNFTGSPQSLLLLPNSYKRSRPHPETSLPGSAVGVERLDKYRYEVKFNRKTDNAILNIYDASGEPLFTEQISQTGTFNLVYNLQWTGLSQVSFEVLSNKGFYRSEII